MARATRQLYYFTQLVGPALLPAHARGAVCSSHGMVSLLSGDVSRTWRVLGATEGSPGHTVELRHHTVTGTRVVFVDNQAVESTLGSSTIFSSFFNDGSDRVSFQLPSGRPAEVAIERTGFASFAYTLLVAGARVPEATEQVDEGSPAFTFVCGVPEAAAGTDELYEPVIWFRVDVKRTTVSTGEERSTSCHRRFRDFGELNEDLRSAFKGHQLLANVPEMPPKELKVLQNHFDAGFVEGRRALLDAMMSRIAQVPRFASSPAVLAFLGMSDQVREASVLFRDGPLGLIIDPSPTMSGRASSSMVVGFKPLDSGEPGPAAASGVVSVGDIISKINGESVTELSHEEVLMKLQAPKPLMVHFLGFQT